jgi:hypothetical protein
MEQKTKLETRTFHQADYPMELSVPEGTEYVEARNGNEVRQALENGMAASVEWCDGRGFFWHQDGKIKADLFYKSRPSHHEFDSIDEALEHVTDVCYSGPED